MTKHLLDIFKYVECIDAFVWIMSVICRCALPVILLSCYYGSFAQRTIAYQLPVIPNYCDYLILQIFTFKDFANKYL